VRRRVPSAPIEDVKKASGVVDVDQAHLHGAKGFGKLAFTAIMFVAEPRPLGTPESSSGSHASARPPAKPNFSKPIDSRATLPARRGGDRRCARRPVGDLMERLEFSPCWWR
jgi:hypothetical protein